MSVAADFIPGIRSMGITSMMSTVAILDNGIIFWDLRDESPTGAHKVTQIAKECFTEVGKPHLVLIDASRGGRETKHELEIYSQFLKQHPLDAIAVYGVSLPLRIIIKTTCMIGGFFNVHFFKDRTAALQWLEKRRFSKSK